MKLIFTLLIPFFLLSCTTKTIFIKPDIPLLARPASMDLKPVNYKISDSGIIIDAQNQKTAILNMTKTERFIKDQQQLITYYENMINKNDLNPERKQKNEIYLYK